MNCSRRPSNLTYFVRTLVLTIGSTSGIKLFNAYIPDTVRFKESPRYKTPLLIEQPTHEGSKAYMTVVEEIINGS